MSWLTPTDHFTWRWTVERNFEALFLALDHDVRVAGISGWRLTFAGLGSLSGAPDAEWTEVEFYALTLAAAHRVGIKLDRYFGAEGSVERMSDYFSGH